MFLSYENQFPSSIEIDTKIENLDLSQKLYKCLKGSEIRTLGDFRGKKYEDLKYLSGFTKSCWKEFEEMQETHGLLE